MTGTLNRTESSFKRSLLDVLGVVGVLLYERFTIIPLAEDVLGLLVLDSPWLAGDRKVAVGHIIGARSGDMWMDFRLYTDNLPSDAGESVVEVAMERAGL